MKTECQNLGGTWERPQCTASNGLDSSLAQTITYHLLDTKQWLVPRTRLFLFYTWSIITVRKSTEKKSEINTLAYQCPQLIVSFVQADLHMPTKVTWWPWADAGTSVICPRTRRAPLPLTRMNSSNSNGNDLLLNTRIGRCQTLIGNVYIVIWHASSLESDSEK